MRDKFITLVWAFAGLIALGEQCFSTATPDFANWPSGRRVKCWGSIGKQSAWEKSIGSTLGTSPACLLRWCTQLPRFASVELPCAALPYRMSPVEGVW